MFSPKKEHTQIINVNFIIFLGFGKYVNAEISLYCHDRYVLSSVYEYFYWLQYI